MSVIMPAVAAAKATPRQELTGDNLGMDVAGLTQGFLRHLEYTLAELQRHVDSEWEPYVALALTVRDRLIQRWVRTQDAYYDQDPKRIYYLSLEYLMGRTLGNSLVAMSLRDTCAQAMAELGYRLEDLREAEWDAGLGNGGLGRLAACFVDSLATLGYPCYGYGLRYDYGIFHQRIVDGVQVEVPDSWLRYGNPWEIARSGDRFRVQFFGRVHRFTNERGRLTHDWVDTKDVLATPFDTPIPGYGMHTVNTLRLWGARAVQEFNLEEFNEGDYVGAIEARARSENICRVLYPNDNVFVGRELRLAQEYFFVSATLQDIIRRYKKRYEMHDRPLGLRTFDRFADKVAVTPSTGWRSCTRTFSRPASFQSSTSSGRESSATRPTASPSGDGSSSAIPSSPRRSRARWGRIGSPISIGWRPSCPTRGTPPLASGGARPNATGRSSWPR